MFGLRSQLGKLLVGIDNLTIWELFNPVVELEQGEHLIGNDWCSLEDSFMSENDFFTCVVRPIHHDYYWMFNLQIAFKKSSTITSIALQQKIYASQIHFLDRKYAWKSIEKQEFIDSLTPACMAGILNGQTVRLEFSRHAGITFDNSPGQFTLFFDHAAIHPRVSYKDSKVVRRDAYQAFPGHLIEVTANLYIQDDVHVENFSPQPWRFPDGKLACFVITDHADWDTTEKIQSLYSEPNGINATHIKTTKSVFYGTIPFRTPEKIFQPDGLDVPGFTKIADELHAAGHEICPHSIVVRPRTGESYVPKQLVVNALDWFALHYSSGTWIDHAMSPGQAINYSQQGYDSTSEWYLLNLIRERGFINIWSYYDFLDYPAYNINQLSFPDDSKDYLDKALEQIIRGDYWKFLNYLKFSINTRIGPEGQQDIFKLAQFIKIVMSHDLTLNSKLKKISERILDVPRTLIKLPFYLADRKPKNDKPDAMFPVIYCETGLSLGQASSDDLLMFTTSAIINYSVAWGLLKSLVREHGIHVAHTYLCNTTINYGDSTLVFKQGKWQISNQFANLLSQIDQMVICGEIWNPTMKDFSTWFKNWAQIRVDPVSHQRLRITNPTRNLINGFSLVFPSDVRAVFIGNSEQKPQRQNPVIYSFDIQPNSVIDASWV